MSAVPAEVFGMDRLEEWRLVYTGRIRGIQARHQRAHDELLNWGRWTRELADVYPSRGQVFPWSPAGVATHQELREWASASDVGDLSNRKRSEPLTEVKPDPADELPSAELAATELNDLIHAQDFPAVWRKIIAKAYSRRLPPLEYQLPNSCGFRDPDDFAEVYDAMLAYLDEVL